MSLTYPMQVSLQQVLSFFFQDEKLFFVAYLFFMFLYFTKRYTDTPTFCTSITVNIMCFLYRIKSTSDEINYQDD